eukprot:11566661-Karenia_brevis.AAC.1
MMIVIIIIIIIITVIIILIIISPELKMDSLSATANATPEVVPYCDAAPLLELLPYKLRCSI